MSKEMKKRVEQAKSYVSFYTDDALSPEPFDIEKTNCVLVGWQCGFEPLFVAVKSYLPGARLTSDEATELATELLAERNWFEDEPTYPDYVVHLELEG